MGTYNRHVKFELKIHNRLGKITEKLQGGIFLTRTVYVTFTCHCVSTDNAMSHSELRLSDIQLSVASGNDDDDDGHFPTFELHPQLHGNHRRTASTGPRARRQTARAQNGRHQRTGSLPIRTK